MFGFASRGILSRWVPLSTSSGTSALLASRMASCSGSQPVGQQTEAVDLLSRMEQKAVAELQGMVSSSSPRPSPPDEDAAAPVSGAPVENDTELGEQGGPTGKEPTRFGDWERNGRCTDF